MNALLWILQVLLAAVFAAHGWLLLSPPPDVLALMNESMSTEFRLFLGAAEVAAAAGLTLPGLTRILPWLVPAAAAGVTIVMIGAVVLHVRRSEWQSTAITFLLLVLATFVAYQRWRVRPILARTARQKTAHDTPTSSSTR